MLHDGNKYEIWISVYVDCNLSLFNEIESIYPNQIQGVARVREKENKKKRTTTVTEQTHMCIGRSGSLWLTTLWEGRCSDVLLLYWSHLLLVHPLFLCKARNPRVLLKSLYFNNSLTTFSVPLAGQVEDVTFSWFLLLFIRVWN